MEKREIRGISSKEVKVRDSDDDDDNDDYMLESSPERCRFQFYTSFQGYRCWLFHII